MYLNSSYVFPEFPPPFVSVWVQVEHKRKFCEIWKEEVKWQAWVNARCHWQVTSCCSSRLYCIAGLSCWHRQENAAPPTSPWDSSLAYPTSDKSIISSFCFLESCVRFTRCSRWVSWFSASSLHHQGVGGSLMKDILIPSMSLYSRSCASHPRRLSFKLRKTSGKRGGSF